MNAQVTSRDASAISGEWLEKLLQPVVSPGTVLRRNEPMARRTTLRVGGPADLYVEPATESDLSMVARLAGEHSVPLFILGRGSNLLVRDGGIRGIVVCLAQNAFRAIEVSGTDLTCGAGARLKDICTFAKQRSLEGLEFLEGIPGSLGGALRMNAGAMGSSVFDRVRSVRVMDRNGDIRVRAAAELAASYRNCAALREGVALSGVLCARPGSPEAIQSKMNEYSRKRWASQPAAPSAGCIFKNPGSVPAGKLIDELGLKGTRVGGAVVSSEHGNFIVNDGDATARDVLDLIESLQASVLRERGIRLDTEVEIIGE